MKGFLIFSRISLSASMVKNNDLPLVLTLRFLEAICSFFNTFMAKMTLVSFLRTMKTLPKVPLPMTLIKWKSSLEILIYGLRMSLVSSPWLIGALLSLKRSSLFILLLFRSWNHLNNKFSYKARTLSSSSHIHFPYLYFYDLYRKRLSKLFIMINHSSSIN